MSSCINCYICLTPHNKANEKMCQQCVDYQEHERRFIEIEERRRMWVIAMIVAALAVTAFVLAYRWFILNN